MGECVKGGVFLPPMDRRGEACNTYIKDGGNLVLPLHLILILEGFFY